MKRGFSNEIKHVKASTRDAEVWADTLVNVTWHRELGRFLILLWRVLSGWVRFSWSLVRGGPQAANAAEHDTHVGASEAEADAEPDVYDRFLRGENLSDDDADEEFEPSAMPTHSRQGTPSPDESDDDSGLEERRGSSSDEDEHARGRKRGRSSGLSTPARSPSRDRDPLSSAADTLDADSPLSKRKRMARSRSSKLKLVVPLNEEDNENGNDNDDGNPSADASSQESGHATALLPPSILDQLSPEDDEFLSALAAEMEGSMAS